MDGYSHYIRITEAGVITHGFSSAFEQPQGDDILIQADGPRHFSQVWPEPLTNDRGQYRYKWVDGERVERAQSELDAEWSSQPPVPPSSEQRIAELEAKLAIASQAAADANDTQQQLLNYLVEAGVI